MDYGNTSTQNKPHLKTSSDKEIDPRDYWDLFDKLSELFPNDGEEQLHTKVEKFFKKRD